LTNTGNDDTAAMFDGKIKIHGGAGIDDWMLAA